MAEPSASSAVADAPLSAGATLSSALPHVSSALAASLTECADTSTSQFDSAVEELLSRIDEISLRLDGLRASVLSSADLAYPPLLVASAPLLSLFATIDQTEACVAVVHKAAKAASDRCVSSCLQPGCEVSVFHPQTLPSHVTELLAILNHLLPLCVQPVSN